MIAPSLPPDEAERLAALRSCAVLDTACEAAFDDMARLAARVMATPIALVTLVDTDRQWFKARQGLDLTETPREHSFCAHAICETGPFVVNDASLDPRFADNPLVTGDPNIRFYAGMPLVTSDGHALGTLCVIDREPREITAEQSEALLGLARAVTTTLELRRMMRRVQDLALTDALTGLANRPAFRDALDRTIARQQRHGEAFALLYLDLDGFKQVNDVRGHAVGDAALRTVGATLAACVRRGDLAARLGGDEFAVLLAGAAEPVAKVAERLHEAITERMLQEGLLITASIGAVGFPLPPPDADGALRVADHLMYCAKRAGRNRVVAADYEAGTEDGTLGAAA